MKIEDQPPSNKNFWAPSVVAIVTIIFIVLVITKLFIFVQGHLNTANVPQQVPPIVNENPTPTAKPEKIELLSAPYSPSQNVFTNPDVYIKNQLR